MLKFGLTGGIGSGKSTIANIFEELGANVIDADLISRQVVERGTVGLNKIANHFGNFVIDHNGDLNRGALRKIIFDSQKEKQWLEELLHPMIRDSIVQQLNKPTKIYHLLVSPLLFETKQNLLVNKSILVDCSIETQISRTMQRDGIDNELVNKIIQSQMSREEKCSLSDYVINNDGSLEQSKVQVDELHNRLITPSIH